MQICYNKYKFLPSLSDGYRNGIPNTSYVDLSYNKLTITNFFHHIIRSSISRMLNCHYQPKFLSSFYRAIVKQSSICRIQPCNYLANPSFCRHIARAIETESMISHHVDLPLLKQTQNSIVTPQRHSKSYPYERAILIKSKTN